MHPVCCASPSSLPQVDRLLVYLFIYLFIHLLYIWRGTNCSVALKQDAVRPPPAVCLRQLAAKTEAFNEILSTVTELAAFFFADPEPQTSDCFPSRTKERLKEAVASGSRKSAKGQTVGAAFPLSYPRLSPVRLSPRERLL